MLLSAESYINDATICVESSNLFGKSAPPARVNFSEILLDPRPPRNTGLLYLAARAMIDCCVSGEGVKNVDRTIASAFTFSAVS